MGVSLYDRIYAGDFNPKSAYPDKPKVPEILKKKAHDLTDAELASIPRLRNEYEAACAEAVDLREKYNSEVSHLHSDFYKALCEEYGVNPDDPFVKGMMSLAWDKGHANGYSEVASIFDDFIPLHVIYERAVKGK